MRGRSGRLLAMSAALVAATTAVAWWISRPAPATGEQPGVLDSRLELASPREPALPRVAETVADIGPVDVEQRVAERRPEPEPLLQPWPLEITVVDVGEQPVADARVDVWEAAEPAERLRKLVEGARDELARLPAEQLEEKLGAFVAQLEHPTWMRPRLSLRTDGSGRCTIPDATAETLLAAEKEGVGTSGACRVVTDRLTMTLRPPASVKGVVRDADDRPIAGATVRFRVLGVSLDDESGARGPEPILSDAGPRTPQPVTSDADGEFEVAVDANALGSACAYIGSPERASVEAIFSVDAGEVEELQLYFAEGAISGRVTWDDGEPAQGAYLTARIQGDGSFRADESQHDIAGADGGFQLDHLRPGQRYTVDAWAMKPAGVGAEKRDVETGTSDLALVLSRKDAQGVTLRGRVVDMETGEPVRSFETVSTIWSSPHRMKMPNQKAQSWESDDGRFEMPRLPVGWVWAVEIRAPDHEPAVFGPLHPANDTEFELELGRAGGLSVEVVDAGGRPASAVDVALFSEVTLDGRDLTAAVRSGVTGADGRCTLSRLAPGSRWLLAANASSACGPVRVDVPSGRDGSVQVRLSTAPPDTSVRVVVLDRERRPLPGIDVNVVLTHASTLGWLGGYTSAQSEELAFMTDASGVAIAERLRPGIQIVSVFTDDVWIPPHFVVAEPGAQLEVELQQQ